MPSSQRSMVPTLPSFHDGRCGVSGVRLDRHMQPKLNVTFWGSFWDYSFVALNGEKAGAVGFWCQDKETHCHRGGI